MRQLFSRRKTLIGGVVIPILYDDVSIMYTLRRPSMTTLWTNAVAKIRRTSDNQTAFLFIDGSSIDDTISLSSLISTSSNTTPSATTLGTWVGANDGFVEEWIGITPDNTIDSDKTAIQTTTTLQPQLISSGAIILENGSLALDFLGDVRYFLAPANTDLDEGKTFTFLTVSNNLDNNSARVVFSAGTGGDRLTLNVDSRTQKNIVQVITGATNAIADYINREQTINQRLLSGVVDGVNKDATPYFQGVIQLASSAWTGAYTNPNFYIGDRLGPVSSNLNGTLQEIIIFPSDKTADLTDLHNDIDTYYSIP